MSRELKGEPFASLLTKRPRFQTSSGSREANVYEMQIDKRGHKVLKCTGTKDIWTEIQSYKEECKIENIIARAAAGDMAALNARNGFYADVTESPANLMEAQNSILKLTNYFEKLDPETREKFDNSKERFVQLYGTKEWLENMGIKEEKAETAEKIDFVPGTTEAAKDILTPEVKE